MSEAGMVAIIVSCITGVPAILAAILANRGRQHARAARHQVENDHTTNFREDQDKQTEQLSLGLRLLLSAKSDIRGLRRDIGRIYDRLDQHESWIHEGTDNPRERK
jgi:hypothetical protein